ncbi:MAG: permease-like cell division protein FtsX [Clostridiales bacterium]|nr:permease-like cell division protein FtsX [Clostridiales bacterium]
MRKINLLFYSVKQGMKSMYHNRLFTLASIGTIATCLFIFGLFFFLLTNFESSVNKVERTVGITIFFKEGITEKEIKEIGNKIKAKPEVDHIVYTSAEEAWENCKKDMLSNNPDLIDTFGKDNPLENSASYDIYLSDLSKQQDMVDYLGTLEGVRQINSSLETANNMIAINSLVTGMCSILIGVLLFVSLFLIHTTVKMGIAVRKEEIAVMRLIGASDFVIRSPFMVEGITMGLIGSAIPLGVLYLIYRECMDYMNSYYAGISSWINFISVKEEFMRLIPAALAIGVGMGVVGSYFTVRKHLKI